MINSLCSAEVIWALIPRRCVCLPVTGPVTVNSRMTDDMAELTVC